jgi:diadenosine tetraphosphate (Ap4A) HIT family hydrolase
MERGKLAKSAAACVFCTILEAPVGEARAYDRVLLDSPRLVLLPALGALVPGHVLVISRSHSPSLSALGTAAVSEYEDVVLRYRTKLHLQVNDVLEAEHGAGASSRGGGCIEHAHINLIPGVANCIDVLDELLPSIDRIADLHDLTDFAGQPYIFLRTSTAIRVFDATTAPSQLIRRRICERLGRDDWDWALFDGYDNISATLAMWASPP